MSDRQKWETMVLDTPVRDDHKAVTDLHDDAAPFLLDGWEPFGIHFYRRSHDRQLMGVMHFKRRVGE